MNEQILQEISEFCRSRGLAESTFGRRAVNDGKLASRLRNGGRITTDTLERIRTFMARNADGAPARRRVLFEPTPPGALPVIKPAAPPVASGLASDDPQRNFRFFDNRQKYLLFVNTCSEKWEVAHRVSEELAHIHPRPPAVRIFDAGVGDGSVLVRPWWLTMASATSSLRRQCLPDARHANARSRSDVLPVADAQS